MTLIEAKETLAKAHLCEKINCAGWKCLNCELYTDTKQEKEAIHLLFVEVLERRKHETGDRT